jgi:hypothetical protein
MKLYPSYDKFIFSEDKSRLLCQLTIDNINDQWSYCLFPLPLYILNEVFEKVEDDFDKIFYNPEFDIDNLNYGILMNLGQKIEFAVKEEVSKYPFWSLPDYLTSYFDVDIDAFEDWKASFFNPNYIRSILIPNRFYDKKVNSKIDKDVFFIINILRIHIENKNSFGIILKPIEESFVIPLLSEEYAGFYFQKTLEEKLSFKSIDFSNSYEAYEPSNDNPFIFAMNSREELEFCIVNIPNNDEIYLFDDLADSLAQNLFKIIDR